jgi:hypothetical protein
MRSLISARYDGGMIRLLAALIAAALFHSAALAAEPVFPPGSRIGIVPPPGMTVSRSFQGFEDRAHGAVLVLSGFAVESFAKAERDFSDERMRAGGMELVARETIGTGNGNAQLVIARQVENGVAMRKWALLGITRDMTAVVILSMPESAREAYPDATVRAALASVITRPKLTAEEMLAVLPYRLTDLAGFHLMRVAANGTAALTLGPKDTALPVQQPYFTIAPLGAPPPRPEERGVFAQRALATFINRPDFGIVKSEPVRIGGVPGHEIIATAIDEYTGDTLMMVQWLQFNSGAVVGMFGAARREEWAGALVRMRTLRDGFEPK